MNKDYMVNKILNVPSILIVCGTVLTIYGHSTFGIVMASLGIAGAIFGFAIDVHSENQEREEREKLYENIQTSLSAIGISFPGIQQDGNDIIH